MENALLIGWIKSILFKNDLRKISFYSLIVLAIVVLVSYQNCGKVTFSAKQSVNTSLSCGSISMTPQNGLYPITSVNFEAQLPVDSLVSDLQWNFSKDTNSVFTATENPVLHTFDGINEGPGSYTAKVTFQKSDGNSCELEQVFQILTNDLCVDPSGISGPTVAYVGDETSPFSVDFEECFIGNVSWDMNSDGFSEHTVPANESITHIYAAVGTYTITGTVTNSDTATQTILTSTIDIRNKSCAHPFLLGQSVPHDQTVEFSKQDSTCGSKPCLRINRTCKNGSFDGDISFSENPTTCQASVACPPRTCTVITDPLQPNVVIPLGQTLTRYKKSATCGQACEVSSFTCQDSSPAVYSFPAGFIYPDAGSCSVASNCVSCKVKYPNDAATYTVALNTTVTRFAKTAACGPTCQSQSFTCNQTIANDGTTFTFPTGYTFTDSGNCNAQNACALNCNLPWGGSVAHGATVTAYQSSSVTYPATCTSEGRVCNNGTLSGSFGALTCTQIINGSCGSSNGGTFASAPTTNLCSSGSASAIAGSGPWTWSCAGANGGSNASCSAAKTITATPGCWTCNDPNSECYPGPAAGCGYGGYVTAHGVPDLRGTACANQGDTQSFKRLLPAGVICDQGAIVCGTCDGGDGGGGLMCTTCAEQCKDGVPAGNLGQGCYCPNSAPGFQFQDCR